MMNMITPPRQNLAPIRWTFLGLALALFITLIRPESALAADGTLPQMPDQLSGPYCMTSSGVALRYADRGTVDLHVDGQPVAAYLFWSARDKKPGRADRELVLTINGGTPIQVIAEAGEEEYAGYLERHYYSYRSQNLAARIPANSNTTAEISGLVHFEPHGASLVVIYENPDRCPISQFDMHYGLDSFSRQRTGLNGPASEVTCTQFEAADIDRTLTFHLAVGGVEGPHRGNALWYQTGMNALPTELINVPGADQFQPPHAHGHPYPLHGDGGEWDNIINQIHVPAGATYACLQFDSIQTIIDGEPVKGTSAVWVNLITHLPIPQEPPRESAIQIEKEAVQEIVEAGQPIGFSIVVTSSGDDIAKNVLVTDPLPLAPGISWRIDASQSDIGCAIEQNILTCAFGDLAPMESRRVHLVSTTTTETTPDCERPTQLNNVATVIIDNGTTDQDDAGVGIFCQPRPGIDIVKTADAKVVTAGEPIGFVMTVTSNGNTAAQAVTLTDPLPPIDGSSWSIDTAASDIGCGIDNGVLTCHFGDLEPNQSRRVHVTTSTAALATDEVAATCRDVAAEIDNVGYVTILTGESDQDDAHITILCRPHPGIDIVKTADAEVVTIGEPIGFVMTVTSNGNTKAQDVILTDVLPAVLGVIEGLNWQIDEQHSDAGCAISNQVLTCHFGDLEPGQIRRVHVLSATRQNRAQRFLANTCQDVATQIDNIAQVTILTGQSDQDDASIQILCLREPDITITKTADKTPVVVGKPLGFTIVVTSVGDVAAENVTVADPLPTAPGIEWQIDAAGSDSGCQIVNGLMTCLFGRLAPGESRRVHVVAPTTIETITDDCQEIVPWIDNTATVTIDGGYTDQDQDTIRIIPICPPNEGEKKAAIGNYVWEDRNADGLQGDDEPGIAGVAVHLYDANRQLIQTILTDETGHYRFGELTPGDYSVQFETPADFVPTLQDQQSDDRIDSDADIVNGHTIITTLISGEFDETWDAGFFRPVTVGDYVWYDEMMPRGIQDAGENGVRDVTVVLHNSLTGHPVERTLGIPLATITNAEGRYRFENLPPGDYYVVFDLKNLPVSFMPTNSNIGSDDRVDSDAIATIGETEIRTSTTGFLYSGDIDLTLDLGIRLCHPTAVTLAGFQAQRTETALEIVWTTSNESNTWGYHIWRSPDQDRKNAVRITSQIILAKGQGGSGSQYRFTDELSDTETTAYYWLEEIETECTKSWHGPYKELKFEHSVETVMEPVAYLPLIKR
ncbi:DUF11 domain-containing protein [Chloroflexi bacterium TSY]|nr:DUF11 domain-containing protein [Chloroflexi bacterium TSY]